MFQENVFEKTLFVLYCLCLLAFSTSAIYFFFSLCKWKAFEQDWHQSIEYIKNMKAGSVKIYDANPEVLKLLSGTKIHVSIMVPSDQISHVASCQENANQWVRENVLAYYPRTRIQFVLVRNEVLSYNDTKMWADLVPAMRNIKIVIRAHKIYNIKVGTPLAMDMIKSTYPPSSGKFRPGVEHVMISLDFALFRPGNSTYKDKKSGLVYTNLLDQMLDSVIFGMKKLGYSHIRLGIAETGWPNGGDVDEPGANIHNAAVYLRNLVQKMTSVPPTGTPARRGADMPTFIFSLYNENQKLGRGSERNWGLLNSSGKPMYELDLTGKQTGSSCWDPLTGKLWCVVAKQMNIPEVPINATSLFCGQGNGTCDALKPEGECYKALMPRDHANYAFSSYWAMFWRTGAT
ncbi:glucosidase [Lithospermum erythrorhizon]|uniref:Glucosidase n=1 Tax=Lithospermum erythrorhizon TaxID=34254 RepID=A0AAV3NKA5_LITER